MVKKAKARVMTRKKAICVISYNNNNIIQQNTSMSDDAGMTTGDDDYGCLFWKKNLSLSKSAGEK